MLTHLFMWLLILGAVTASKPVRRANRDQARTVKGTASATVSATACLKGQETKQKRDSPRLR